MVFIILSLCNMTRFLINNLREFAAFCTTYMV